MADHVEICTVIVIKCTENGQGLSIILCTIVMPLPAMSLGERVGQGEVGVFFSVNVFGIMFDFYTGLSPVKSPIVHMQSLCS